MPDRDWQKDWELCQRATPGPWRVGTYRDWLKDWELCQEATPGPWAHDHSQGKNAIICCPSPGVIVPWSKDVRFEDAAFIAAAREALPYWLQRVRELETQVQDLKERAEAAEEAAVDYARRLDQFHKENEELQERWRELKKSVVAVTATNYNLERAMKRLEAENHRLKAVAEAAKLVVDEWTLSGKPMMEAPIRHLQDALAVLEGGNKDG